MAKVKSLSVAAMKKADAKEFSEKQAIDVQGYEVVIDKKLRTSKVKTLVAEVFNDLDELGKRGFDLKNFDINGYVLFQMIKHFSSLDIPTKLEEKLTVFNMMLDNGFFYPIVNAFGDEVKKIDEVLSTMVGEIESRTEKLHAEIAKIEAEQQGQGDAQETPENQEG